VIATTTRAARLRSAVPAILGAEAAGLPACVDRSHVLAAHVTSTGLGIAIVGRRRARPCVAVKLALTAGAAAGLEREGRALAALHADARLEGWRPLVPRRLATGALSGRCYAIDSAVPDAPALTVSGDATVLAAVQEGAAEAIGVLHRRTAASVVAGDVLVGQWVHAPAAMLAEHGGPRSARVLRELADGLGRALQGRTLTAGWVHGDFWPGNLLVRPDGGLSGIVDWDAAGPRELPLHDVLHLLLYTRRLLGGEELGEVILGQLREPRWSARERRVLRAHGGAADEVLSERDGVLLYWLRHAAGHTRQQAGSRSPGYRVWRRRNVDRVLEAL
jgi:hypothetical protein